MHDASASADMTVIKAPHYDTNNTTDKHVGIEVVNYNLRLNAYVNWNESTHTGTFETYKSTNHKQDWSNSTSDGYFFIGSSERFIVVIGYDGSKFGGYNTDNQGLSMCAEISHGAGWLDWAGKVEDMFVCSPVEYLSSASGADCCFFPHCYDGELKSVTGVDTNTYLTCDGAIFKGGFDPNFGAGTHFSYGSSAKARDVGGVTYWPMYPIYITNGIDLRQTVMGIISHVSDIWMTTVDPGINQFDTITYNTRVYTLVYARYTASTSRTMFYLFRC